MAEVTIEFNVYCSCGAELVTEVTDASNYNRWQTSVSVEPCEKCMDAAEEKGFREGEKSVS